MEKDNREMGPAVTGEADSKKSIALIVGITPLFVIAVIIFLFIQFQLDMVWLILFIAAEVLMYPVVWANVVSPHLTSEEGALHRFDQLMGRLNILKKLPKGDE
jgi:hypothetical protein